MRLKIVSDGTPENTDVVNAATGERVEGLCAVTWSVQPDEFGYAYITLERVEIDVVGEVEERLRDVAIEIADNIDYSDVDFEAVREAILTTLANAVRDGRLRP